MQPHRTASPLVAFLYQLMRDEVPIGTVEGIVKADEEARAEHAKKGEPLEFVLTNGHLGTYAEEVASRLLDDG